MYRAVIIGLGKIAWRYDDDSTGINQTSRTHAKAYLLNPNVELVAGCSTSKKDRVDFQKIYEVEVYENYEEMIKKVKPDIISICTPLAFHYEQLMACLKHNIKMVWLEKPPLDSLKLVEDLSDYQRKTPQTCATRKCQRIAFSRQRKNF